MWKIHAHTLIDRPDRRPTPRQVYSREGPIKNGFQSPQGLWMTRNENLLIVDSANHRIMKYDLIVGDIRRMAGKDIQGYASDLLAKPSSVIYHKSSKSYIICDYHNRRVLQWFRRGKSSSKTIISNIACFGLAVDEKGYIYVSDTDRHEVRRYRVGKKHGKLVAGGGGQGGRLNQLNNPTYICIGHDQSVYISDSHNNRVVRWDKGSRSGVVVAGKNRNGIGKDLKQLNCPAGVLVDQLNCPAGVLVDQLNTVYVADHWNHRVMRWPANGKPDIIAGDRFLSGSDSNKLTCPEGLAFDKDGNLYVADSNNNRIQRFRRETTSNMFSLR